LEWEGSLFLETRIKEQQPQEINVNFRALYIYKLEGNNYTEMTEAEIKTLTQTWSAMATTQLTTEK
jgi:hypothetical protein